MMQLNPRPFLRAAATATVLRPTTTAVVPRALQTSMARTLHLTRRLLFPAHHRAFSTTRYFYYYRKADVDIKELPDAYSYVVDVPGIRAGDLTVNMVPGRWLTIIVARREETVASAICSYHLKQRPMGKLHLSFGLTGDADLGSVSAVCRDSVLTVTQ
jgi:HSP20 family molecular chaperone IbpA